MYDKEVLILKIRAALEENPHLSHRELGPIVGCSRTTVSRLIAEAGIPTQPRKVNTGFVARKPAKTHLIDDSDIYKTETSLVASGKPWPQDMTADAILARQRRKKTIEGDNDE